MSIKYNDNGTLKDIAGRGAQTAATVSYNNTGTGLSSTTVQDAITELNNDLANLIIFEKLTDDTGITIPANSSQSHQFIIPAKTGYTPVLAFDNGGNTNNAVCTISVAKIDDVDGVLSATFYYRNLTGNGISTYKGQCYVMYVKN